MQDAGDQGAAAPSDNTTLSAVLEQYEEAGYTIQFTVGEGGSVVCGNCAATTSPAELPVRSRRRLEGASDPADMAVVHAVSCPACGQGGTVVSRYGPEADEDETAFLVAVRQAAGDDSLPRDAEPGGRAEP